MWRWCMWLWKLNKRPICHPRFNSMILRVWELCYQTQSEALACPGKKADILGLFEVIESVEEGLANQNSWCLWVGCGIESDGGWSSRCSWCCRISNGSDSWGSSHIVELQTRATSQFWNNDQPSILKQWPTNRNSIRYSIFGDTESCSLAQNNLNAFHRRWNVCMFRYWTGIVEQEEIFVFSETWPKWTEALIDNESSKLVSTLWWCGGLAQRVCVWR